MSKKLRYTVVVSDDKGEQHTFGPKDTVPAWAQKAIRNPGAWGEGSDTTDTSGGGGGSVYDSQNKAELEAEVDRRNEDRADDDKIVVGGKGNKPDLVAALEADDQA